MNELSKCRCAAWTVLGEGRADQRVRALSRQRRISFGEGFEVATHFDGTIRNEKGQSRAIVLTLVTGPGDRTYWLQSVARDNQARQRAEAGLKEAEASFRPMPPADRAAAKPWTVQTVPFPRGGFAELAKSSTLPAASAEAQLRLMNGAYSGGADPKPGQAVKVVR
ncbi:hypothetical protein WKW77_33180 [Variovorax ureilyticus]|uniref:Uncharacterized protein n=1 Tax=Variovorax ureilyticus TaxID=1836198 RepID=A0ABU8VR59_9BURK